jgi:hypothetical protein
MDGRADCSVAGLIKELDRAAGTGDVIAADDAADRLYRLQGGTDADAAMPSDFPARITGRKMDKAGGQPMKGNRFRKLIGLAVAAALVLALCFTALATDLFGLRDLVMQQEPGRGSIPETEGPAENSPAVTGGPEQDLIALQGYPDSSEYKASEEWNLFRRSYDTDGSILGEVGNGSNEYTEKYPMYLVYSKDMADKLAEIAAKYGLKLHESMTVVGSAGELYEAAGTGGFLTAANGGSNTQLGGYVYNDGTFHFDGEAFLEAGKNIPYQFGNYVKGTFSDTYLNVGNADVYRERAYTTSGGMEVSLAISENKSLVIADLPNSFVVINVLTGSENGGSFGGSAITLEDLQGFADMFDFSMIP